MSTELTAPPSCARLHPGEPSELRLRSDGKVACRRCGRTYERRRQANPLTRKRYVDPKQPYGVLPRLEWVPPSLISDGGVPA